MKRIFAAVSLLIIQRSYAEVYVINHTPYDIVVQISWTVAGKTFSEGFKGNKIAANSEGFVTDPLGNKTEDHAWSKVRYQIKANKSQNPKTDTKDYVDVYDTQKDHWAHKGYEAGGYRNLTVFTRQDENGNEVFDIDDSLR